MLDLSSPEIRASVWHTDRIRGVHIFNDFFYCYLREGSPDVIELALRMQSCITDDACWFSCRVLGLEWIGSPPMDFRPDIWSRMRSTVGIPYPTRDAFKISPPGISVEFLANARNTLDLDFSTAWWLPPPLDYSWVRTL